MEEWKDFKTSDFGYIVTGNTPDTKNEIFWNGDYPFYSPADFTNDLFCNKTERTVSKSGLLTGRIIPENSIMVACIASIGKMALNTESGITNQQINTIVVNEGSDFKYIYYLLLFNVNKIKSIAPQTTIPIINKTTFSNLFFYSTSNIVEQRKIAEILSTIDKVIEQTQELIGKYINIKKGLMQDLLSYGVDKDGNIRNPETHNFVEKNGMIVPEEWEVEEIGKNGFVTKLAGFEYTMYFNYEIGGEIIVIRGLNLKNGNLDLSEIHTIPEKTSNMLLRSKLYVNDIVISYVGTVGEIAVINENDKYHLAPNVAKISFNTNHFNPYFVKAFLMGEAGKKAIVFETTSTTQAALNMGNIRKIRIPKPSVIEQKDIIKTIEQQDKLIESEQTNLTKLQKQKQGLMQDLLTGKVRVNF